ncbi:MAG: ATP-binding protein, partial [Planctomycetota bacterium]|nr:ATP-binding protein [Planctomycetota bacterium]
VLNAVEAMKKMEDLSERMLSISTTGVDGDMVEVAVCDTGGHAGDMDAERMFQAFYTSKQEGLGVGLWLSRTIIEAHGGSLTAHHNTNRGMTFRIAVPAICERGET